MVSTGLVVRGFSGWFLEREGVLEHLRLFEGLPVATVRVSATQRLALFVVSGIVVSLVGVRVAAAVSRETVDEPAER